MPVVLREAMTLTHAVPTSCLHWAATFANRLEGATGCLVSSFRSALRVPVRPLPHPVSRGEPSKFINIESDLDQAQTPHPTEDQHFLAGTAEEGAG